MSNYLLIRNAIVVNEGRKEAADVLVKDGYIEKIAPAIRHIPYTVNEINAEGMHLMPGVIDDQVHFREPGMTYKADIYSESRAAVAGGVTSFMEMPNTRPAAVTLDLLEEKYAVASQRSLANYSFFMGATNDNMEELKRLDREKVCGIKVFMGSSTGNMLVDRQEALEQIFSAHDMLIAIHSEDEATIRNNYERYKERYGDNIPMWAHPEIRSVEACFLSTEKAVALARKHDTRLHVLHISTADELQFFRNDIPLAQKRITAEVCVHHLWFSSEDYASLGGKIKCNPAIKAAKHRDALLPALLDDRLDIIATDHAPHTADEKKGNYDNCPSGLPLVQHALQMMLQMHSDGKISMEDIVRKMCHAPADCFKIKGRGFIREGYKADLVLVDAHRPQTVNKDNIFYKCGWSPMEGNTFSSTVYATIVNGNVVYKDGILWDNGIAGERLLFN